MGIVPRSPVGAGPHFDELGAELRRRGLRITWSRLAVLELLRSTTTPLAGDEITARVARIQRDRSTAYQTLKVLESAGLVARSPVPEDRRASLVGLTGEGKALIDRLQGVMRATEDALTDGLGEDDVQTTRRVLAQVTERARALRAGRSG